jgi:intergrase/recombinase
LSENLDVLRGSLAETYLTCGTPGCRCHEGEKHGPYYILSWSEGGKRRSVHVPADKVERVRRMIANYQAVREALLGLGDVSRQLVLEQYEPKPRRRGGGGDARS